jgi:hypothetical protein
MILRIHAWSAVAVNPGGLVCQGSPATILLRGLGMRLELRSIAKRIILTSAPYIASRRPGCPNRSPNRQPKKISLAHNYCANVAIEATV